MSARIASSSARDTARNGSAAVGARARRAQPSPAVRDATTKAEPGGITRRRVAGVEAARDDLRERAVVMGKLVGAQPERAQDRWVRAIGKARHE